jgi:O-antigen/teichoic acid export membrane protein
MSLSQKALSGFSYTFSSTILSKIITLIGGIYLARLLNPEDFGLLAMLYIIFEVSGFLISSGFGLVLIREKNVSEEDLSTVFWFNLAISSVLVLTVWLLSQHIVKFYEEPRLFWLSRIMSLNLLFSAFGIVQKSMFQRRLEYKKLSVALIVSNLLAITIAIALAYNNFGFYALAIKYVLISLISSVILYIYNPWKPSSFINIASFKRLFAFGGNVMLLGLVNTLSRNIHQIVIGKFFSTSLLGFFNQGNMLKDNLVNTVSTSISQVTFPILSKLQDDKQRLKEGYSRILAISTYVIFPIVIIFIFIAKPLILFLLGEKWQDTTLFFQILLIGGALNHIHGINLNVLKVYGGGKDYLMQGIIRNGITILLIIIGVQVGVVGIAFGLIISEFLQLFVNTYYSNKYIHFKFSEQVNVILPIIILNLLFIFISISLEYLINTNSISFLFAYPIVYLISYFCISKYFQLVVYTEIQNLVLIKFQNIKINNR